MTDTLPDLRCLIPMKESLASVQQRILRSYNAVSFVWAKSLPLDDTIPAEGHPSHQCSSVQSSLSPQIAG